MEMMCVCEKCIHENEIESGANGAKLSMKRAKECGRKKAKLKFFPMTMSFFCYESMFFLQFGTLKMWNIFK